MRAEGVLRLILNVALYSGMSCERQDKYVRLAAFEDGKLVPLAIRLGTAKAAEDLVRFLPFPSLFLLDWARLDLCIRARSSTRSRA